MNTIFTAIIPILFLCSFVFALYKKVPLFDVFCEGAKKAIPLIVSIFPYVAFVATAYKLMQVSGLERMLIDLLSPVFSWLGVPTEIAPLVFIKPLSGSGSIAMLTEIIKTHGVDSYVARCACTVYGASDTVFYISAVYFAGLERKKMSVSIAIALSSFLVSVVIACGLCKIL